MTLARSPFVIRHWSFVIFFFFLSTAATPAALTLLTRETFQGVGTLNSASPGNIGTIVNGNFYKRPVGPRLATDSTAAARGWSADVQNQPLVYGQMYGDGSTPVIPSSGNNDRSIRALDYWIYYDTAPAAGRLIYYVGHNGVVLVQVQTGGTDGLALAASSSGAAPTGPGYTVPLRTWVELRVAWAQISGYYNYQASVLARPAGATAFTEIFTAAFQVSSVINDLVYGLGSAAGGAPTSNARLGMFSAYTLDAWADRTLLDATVVDPPAGPFAWFCNSASGNDNNDGTSAGSAWATVSKVNAESANLGMFPTSAGYGNGDTLTFDTTAANLLLGPASLIVNTQGLNVMQLGGGLTGTGELQAWQQIGAGSWTLVSGATKTYQSTLSESNPACVLWENDKWLNHPTGSSLASVLASLESQPGAFWTDGTTMYLHPFGDTNPAADGKIYTRSYNRTGSSLLGNSGTGLAAVNILVPDVHLSGLRVRKTCLADPSTNDPVAAYCYQTGPSSGGTILLENCFGSYGSKHVFGFTDNSITRQYTVRHCQGEQGSPYVGYGGQTIWVDFTASSGTGTATTLYDHCVTNANAGLVGSTAGAYSNGQPVWTSHCGGGSPFAAFTFNACTMVGAGPFQQSGTPVFQVIGGNMQGGSFYNGSANFTGVTIPGPPPAPLAAGVSVVLRNCIIKAPDLSSTPLTTGTVDIQGCTIDFNGGVPGLLYRRTGSMTMTWRNNVIIGDASAVLGYATAADTLMFDHNAYPFSTTRTAWIGAYNDGTTTSDRTLAQWQALGFDSGSFITAAPLLDSSYHPQPGSPLIGAGANIGPLTDFDGVTVFNPRHDIGAFEFAAADALLGGGFFEP